MRLRRNYKNFKRSGKEDNIDAESQVIDRDLGASAQQTSNIKNEHAAKNTKKAKDSNALRPMKMIKQLMSNPNFNMQIMVILLSLTSDNMQMDRRIDGMTTTIDKVRNITELVNNGMQSMKMVSEVPKSIRRILE